MSYDAATATLTLSGADITACYSWTEGTRAQVAGIYAGSDLNIVLVGDNTVTAVDNNDGYSCAVSVDGNLTIDGAGKLDATGGKINSNTNHTSCGIYAYNITINDGTVNATAGQTRGIMAHGVGLFGSIMINGGAVTATGSESEYQSNGVRGNCTVNEGSLTAIGGKATNEASSYSFGINVGYSQGLSVTGGSVIAIGDSAKLSYGINLYTYASTVSGGTILATGYTNAVGVNPYAPTLNFTNVTIMGGADASTATAIADPEALKTGDYKYVRVAPLTYTVTYAPGASGSGSQATDSKTHDIPLTLSGVIFTRAGFTQTGWATTDGGAQAYALSGNYTANAPIDLYPAWTQNVPATGNGGSIPPADTTVYNDPIQPQATIWLSGSGLSGNDLLITQAITSGSNYNAMLKLADSGDILRVYDIFLQSGSSSTGGAMYLTFDLAGQYAGQAFTLVHKKADGAFEYLYATADADGNVKFGPVYELSPFMLVKGSLPQTPSHAARVPKTGDNSGTLTFVLLAFSAVCGVGAAVYKKRRTQA